MPTLKSAAVAFSWPTSGYTVWRYRGLIASAVLLGAASAALLGALGPRTYAGDALVQVEPQQIPDRLVSPPVAGEWQDRLASLNQQILTSARLELLLREFRLFPGERRRLPLPAVLSLMRRHTEIHLERTWTRERPGAFHVIFEYGDPLLAATVANRLARALIELNLRDRKSSATGTFDFLEAQLKQSRREMQIQESRLTHFRQAHIGELPGQEGALLSALNRMQLQWQSAQESIARAEQLRSALSEALYAAQAASLPPAPAPTNAAERFKSQLNTVRSRYTELYPEVRTLQAEASAASAFNLLPPPADNARLLQRVAILAMQLRASTDEQTRLNRWSSLLLSRITDYQTRLERMPLREVEWNSLNSDHEFARQQYRSLLEKRSAAQLSAELERRQKDETFRMLEPARVPVEPKGLGWKLWAWLGSVGGLLAGVSAAFLFDLRRGVIEGTWELPAGMLVLGSVPALGVRLPTTPAARVRRQLRALRTAAALSLGSVI